MKIHKLKAFLLIKQHKGKVFSAEFYKKDNTLRKINCRIGVTSKLTGKGMKYKAIERMLLPVYDMQKKGYRMLNLDTLQTLTIAGERYRVQ